MRKYFWHSAAVNWLNSIQFHNHSLWTPFRNCKRQLERYASAAAQSGAQILVFRQWRSNPMQPMNSYLNICLVKFPLIISANPAVPTVKSNQESRIYLMKKIFNHFFHHLDLVSHSNPMNLSSCYCRPQTADTFYSDLSVCSPFSLLCTWILSTS